MDTRELTDSFRAVSVHHRRNKSREERATRHNRRPSNEKHFQSRFDENEEITTGSWIKDKELRILHTESSGTTPSEHAKNGWYTPDPPRRRGHERRLSREVEKDPFEKRSQKPEPTAILPKIPKPELRVELQECAVVLWERNPFESLSGDPYPSFLYCNTAVKYLLRPSNNEITQDDIVNKIISINPSEMPANTDKFLFKEGYVPMWTANAEGAHVDLPYIKTPEEFNSFYHQLVNACLLDKLFCIPYFQGFQISKRYLRRTNPNSEFRYRITLWFYPKKDVPYQRDLFNLFYKMSNHQPIFNDRRWYSIMGNEQRAEKERLRHPNENRKLSPCNSNIS